MATVSTYNSEADQKAQQRVQKQTDGERSKFIVDVFVKYFGDGIQSNPTAFRGRFRKMAANPFNFYRGSATLFYQDLKEDRDPWITGTKAGRIFIHGDLHCRNFGSYLDNNGNLAFDVNDFDEGYLGPFTWDIKRLMASLNLVAHSKGFGDNEIQQILQTCAEAYLQQVDEFCNAENDEFLLTLNNTTGKIKQLLNDTRVKSHVAHLDQETVIEDYDRKFIRSKNVKDVDEATKAELMETFQLYLKSIPQNKKARHGGPKSYNVKDVVSRSSPGIGSAGKISYNFLLEGPTQTLENDIIVYMKPAQKSAVSYVISSPELDKFFHHDGLRTVLCSYAMQAATPRWLGYSTFRNLPMVVDEYTAHSEDLEWDDINDLNDILEVVKYLGQATAKIHCVADSDCINTPTDVACLPFAIIPHNVEFSIRDAIAGRNADFVSDMVHFGMVYGQLVRRDHALFFEAFRNKRIPGL